MNTTSLSRICGLVAVGSMSLCAGLLVSPKQTNVGEDCRDDNDCSNLGVLQETLYPYMEKLLQVARVYPSSDTYVTVIIKKLKQFAYQYPRAYKNPRIAQKLLKYQRRIFQSLDNFLLHLSESVAVDDAYRASDELKQIITDLCLGIDV